MCVNLLSDAVVHNDERILSHLWLSSDQKDFDGKFRKYLCKEFLLSFRIRSSTRRHLLQTNRIRKVSGFCFPCTSFKMAIQAPVNIYRVCLTDSDSACRA